MPPKLTTPKDSVKPPEPIPAGIYEFRVDGFSPKASKDKNSVNFRPQMKIINHPALNGKPLYDNLNQKAGWIIEGFIHSLSLQMVTDDGDLAMPGTWIWNPSDPENVEKLTYQGPILGRTGRLEYVERIGDNGKKYMAVKQYFCNVSGCQTKHPTELN